MAKDIRVIRPNSSLSADFIFEFWRFRRLIPIFIWRDIVVRYKNTAIGVAWYVLQPLCMMIMFTLFFSRAFNDRIGSIPYPLFAYGGLVLWQMFGRSLALGAGSLVQFETIIGKVYFPRIIAPISMIFGTLFDFAVASLLLVGMMIYYGVGFHVSALAVPAILIGVLACSMGVSCFLAAVDSRYRDVRHTVPLMVQIWMFGSPVMYPSAFVPETWRPFYEINPMVGFTEWFRWVLFRIGNEPDWRSLATAIVVSLVLFVAGVLLFQKMQGTLVDTL